ncbi:pyridoxal-phosphate dependent enzyme (plasmid) [Sinorhizobium meliloti]|nr:pyridoxal-phosphate dependent enzyme [Sinorhizobium meliloti]WKL39068.1 pyridoxal-phosphate dependent enzyme [Sinorhizobium meliloti]
MPPAIKIRKVRENGSKVVLYDRQTQSREQIAAEIAEKSAVAIIPPGDNPFIIAGQGTVAAEALEQAGNVAIDAIMVPCGGGWPIGGNLSGRKSGSFSRRNLGSRTERLR